LAGHFRRAHGHVDLAEIIALLEGSGFQPVASGAVGIKDLYYALATSPPRP
jgi:hypothetical protein